jgi:hypothetical protein
MATPSRGKDSASTAWGRGQRGQRGARTPASCGPYGRGGGWPRLTRAAAPLTFLSRVIVAAAPDWPSTYRCPIDQTPIDRTAVTRKLGSFRTSMLQDADAGRALELDALTGAVREIGAFAGVPNPYVDALHGLTRLGALVRAQR